MAYGHNRFARFWEPQKQLSILDLAKNGTLDLELAGLFWLIMEQRASVIVAALPGYAGKSTLLNILLDFLPPEVQQVHLYGSYGDLSPLDVMLPEITCLVAEEFNVYMDYVWGDVAKKMFELLDKGFSLGGTMHTRNAKEVILLFYQYLGLSLETLAGLGIIVNLHVAPPRLYGAEPIRRIASVGIPLINEENMTIEFIAAYDSEKDKTLIAEEEKLKRLFSSKFGLEDIDITAEIQVRKQALAKLLEEDKISADEVRQAVIDFYGPRDDSVPFKIPEDR